MFHVFFHAYLRDSRRLTIYSRSFEYS